MLANISRTLLFEENECPLCGQTNADVLEDHLLTLGNEYGYEGAPLIIWLCVNCHRVIHRCCWAPISQDSEAVLNRYLDLLKCCLPAYLSQALQDEILAAKEKVAFQYERAGVMQSPKETDSERKCALCGCPNPDFIEEHTLAYQEEYPHLGSDITIDLCGNCHRVILKFYEGKALPTSEESKSLLHEYLAEFGRDLPKGVEQKLAEFLQYK